MNPEPTALRSRTALLWRTNKPLTSTGLLMLTALAAFSIGLMVDPRTIAGAPAWLKPEKFALSIAIYSLTLAWIFTMLPAWRRTRTIVGWITTAVMVLELAIITFQAWRGHASHFNVSTPLDGALFSRWAPRSCLRLSRRSGSRLRCSAKRSRSARWARPCVPAWSSRLSARPRQG